MRKPKHKPDTRGPLQRLIDAEALRQEQSALDIITPEQRAKGGYDGAQRIVNRGGTPVMRWIAANKLSDTQLLAIQLCYRLWGILSREPQITAGYGERMAASTTEECPERIELLVEAKEDLHRIKDYIPWAYYQIFENVVRFDEPAGVAGSRLGFGGRSAEDRAHTVVCFVADIIAMNERLIPVTRIRVA